VPELSVSECAAAGRKHCGHSGSAVAPTPQIVAREEQLTRNRPILEGIGSSRQARAPIFLSAGRSSPHPRLAERANRRRVEGQSQSSPHPRLAERANRRRVEGQSQRKCQSFQKARVRGRGGITAVFGSVVVSSLLIAAQEERLTRRRGPFLEGSAIPAGSRPPFFRSADSPPPFPSPSKQANHRQLEGQGVRVANYGGRAG
jgi:hypothetical protein